MRNLLLTAGAALAVTACASMAPTPRTAAPYMQMAASSDQFEIQSSQLAVQRAQNPQVRQFAQMLIDHHTQTTATLTAAAQQAGLPPPPPVLVPRHAAMLEAVRNAPQAQFDRVYTTGQVPAHAEALALHQNYAASGDNASLRTAASAAVPIVQQHLDEARRLAGGM